MIDAGEAVKVHRDYHKMQANRKNSVLEYSISKMGMGQVWSEDPLVLDAWLEFWKPVWEGLGYKVVHNPYHGLSEVVVIYPPSLEDTDFVASRLPNQKKEKCLTKTYWVIIMFLAAALVALLLL